MAASGAASTNQGTASVSNHTQGCVQGCAHASWAPKNAGIGTIPKVGLNSKSTE